jgi:hypothetical protein
MAVGRAATRRRTATDGRHDPPAAIKNYLTDVELMREALEDDKAAERPI